MTSSFGMVLDVLDVSLLGRILFWADQHGRGINNEVKDTIRNVPKNIAHANVLSLQSASLSYQNTDPPVGLRLKIRSLGSGHKILTDNS